MKTNFTKKIENMKKIMITLIMATIVVFSLSLNAQTFKQNYLGEDFLQYKGALFKLKDDAICGFTHTFYSDLKYCQSRYDNNVIYPEKKYNFKTVKESLANRIFKVEDIIGKDGKPFIGGSYIDEPIFILKDTLTNQIIYYKYDMEYEHNFPFLTDKIGLDLEALCSKIERKVDDFTDEATLNSPIIEGRKIASMIIFKTIKNNSTVYSLCLRTYGSTVNFGETGAIILFDDGTKINKPVKIDVDTDEKGFVYKAFITLTQADLQTLTTKKVKKFRLYIYDKEIKPGEADKFVAYVKCIMDKK